MMRMEGLFILDSKEKENWKEYDKKGKKTPSEVITIK